jgi:hypothetical protein
LTATAPSALAALTARARPTAPAADRARIARSACAQSRPHRRAHGSMSHRQHQAGCPPTVQRGSGSSPWWRQRSSVSRPAPSRWPISTSPTGSCFVCWSAMERRRPAPVRKGDALGAGAGGCWIPVRWDANSCWVIQPRSGPRAVGQGATRDGPPDGFPPPAGRRLGGLHDPRRRNPAGRATGRREEGPPAPPRPGDHRVRGLPG